ncbi:MAG: PASTA domain-containing protein [Eubacteriales bacterium]|nr:PASTA domain-containing protein [Eubacteriales bacterium]
MPCMLHSACRPAVLCGAAALLLCLLTACSAATAAPEVVDVLPSHTPQAAEAANCDIPDLRLETEASAKETLAAHGVRDIEVEYVTAPDVPAGLVTDQSVKAGQCPQKNVPVKLFISIAAPTPEPTAAPAQAPTPTPAPQPTSASKPAATKKPAAAQTPVPTAGAPALITQAPILDIPTLPNQQPFSTPQPTWSFDLGALYDPNSEDCG